MSYATDGKCHNAQPGTFSHECGAPATWIGETANGFRSGFCDQCKQYGWEARDVVRWTPVSSTPTSHGAAQPRFHHAHQV